jgi:hypothetical protein
VGRIRLANRRNGRIGEPRLSGRRKGNLGMSGVVASSPPNET